MKPILSLILVVFMVIVLSACQTVAPAPAPPTAIQEVFTVTPRPVLPTRQPSATPAPSATPQPTEMVAPTADSCPNGDCITACFKKLPQIVNPGDAKAKSGIRSIESEDGITLVTYTINGDQPENPVEGTDLPEWLKPFQQDQSSQTKVWDYFAALIPADQRTYLAEYRVFSDGPDNNLASVVQTETDMTKWALELDILDAANPQDLTISLLHEFAHLLALNPAQVVPSKPIFDNPDSDSVYQSEWDACQTYFPGEGCSLPDSYINQFYDRFWIEIEPEWESLDAIESEEDYQAALERFYEKYQAQFVDDYAVTDPSEDFAETFSVFIREPQPTGQSIAEQKVLFFYEFPELVKLRSQIGHNLCAQLTK
ncbi:MAG: putative zinc-binding metallopeptidase [Chloroflexi bacterium]|nr:putative zinc-binding metallopeptidase [Chloroflexota bacterium]